MFLTNKRTFLFMLSFPLTTQGWTTTPNLLSTRVRQSEVICRISNVFGGSEKDHQSLPKDVKEAVSKCRTATQEALKQRLSRIQIEFPVGTKFNVEQTPKNNKVGEKQGPTQEEFQRSDRELARLFVDMFQPVGGDQIAVVFNDANLADLAKKKWKGDPTARSVILSLDRRKSKYTSKKKSTGSKRKGFASKLAQEMDDSSSVDGQTPSGPFQLPESCQVCLFVNPGPKEFIIIEKICSQVGMETLVILLNARTSSVASWGSPAAKTLFLDVFETVFYLGAAPQNEAPNCLLFHFYPNKVWTLARKPAVGPPQTVQDFDHQPTPKECAAAFETIQISQVEKNVEGVIEGVAKWFS